MNLQKQFNDPVKDDFRNFLYLVWQHLNLPEPTPIQYDIAYYLQHGSRRTIIEAFRGVGKSWITSAFVCWLLLRDPQTKILVISASKTRSDDFSSFTKRLIGEMSILVHLKAKNGQRDSSVAFDVGPAQPDHAPSVKSLGITSQLAGSRADVIIPDDVEVQNNALTQLMRDRLAEAVKEFDAILKPNGLIRYLGTPQTEMSIYNTLDERGYEIKIWPARYPEEPEKYQGRLAAMIYDRILAHPDLAGTPTDPSRFNEADLQEREASYGRSGFALQFMLDTAVSDADRYPLRLSDLVVMGTDKDAAPAKVAWGNGPQQILNTVLAAGLANDRYHGPAFKSADYVPYTGALLTIDPSGRGTDETAWNVTKFVNGFIYLRKQDGFRGGYETKNLEMLARVAKEEAVNLVLIESNFGDGMFTEILKPVFQRIYPCALEETKSTGMKEARIIDTLEPVMNQHRLIVDEGCIQKDLITEDAKYQLFYQLTRITRERGALAKDDRLDVLAMAVAYWTAWIAKDVTSIQQDMEQAAREEQLRKFMSLFNGSFSNNSEWIDDY